MKNKKKILVILIPLLIIPLFVLCLSLNSFSKMTKQKDVCEKLLICLDESDSESLINMFSSYDLKNDSSISECVDELMTYLGGHIESIKEIDGGSEQKTFIKGKITRYSFSSTIRDIVTDNGKKYKIVFGYTMLNTDNPERIGINYITFVDDQHNQLIKIGWE